MVERGSISQEEERAPTPHEQIIYLWKNMDGGFINFILRDPTKIEDQMGQTSRRIDRLIKMQEEPDEQTRKKIDDAYSIVKGFVEIGEVNIKWWWLGMNPELDDQSPAMVFPEDPERVKRAALSFIHNG